MPLMSAAPALVHNFVGDPTGLTQVPLADVQALNSVIPEFEADSYDHWVFDTGDEDGFIGRVNERVLTLETTGGNDIQPTSVGLVGYGNSLVSTLADRDDWTIAAIAKYTSADAFVGGCWGGSGGGGGSLIIGAGTSGEAQSVVDPGGTFNLDATSTPSAGAWTAIAMALDYTTGRRRTLRFQGETASKTDDAADKTDDNFLIAFGNRYYNFAPYSTTVLWLAEAVLWDRALTAAELAAWEERARVRAARRSISVA